MWRECEWSSAPVAGAGRVHDVAYECARDEHGWWLRLEEADPAVGTAH
ncbi:MAG TPA: hypothetical protein VK402_19700 [Blastococcus sp.]|nr:hypothetical protein [Blastococcus sp.]